MTTTFGPAAAPTAPPELIDDAPGTPSGAQPTDALRRGDPGSPQGGPSGFGRTHLLLAELSLFSFLAAAVFGFCRLYDTWEFLAPLLVVTAVCHLVPALCRRRGVGLPLALLASAAVWVFTVTWLFFADTTTALLPTLDTWRTAWAELDRSWEAFHRIVAPAPVQTGFLLATAAAVAAGAFLADWAAFRLWSAREALVPSLTLLIFATLLTDDRNRTLSAVVALVAALAFVLTHRVLTLERADGWISPNRRQAGWSMLRAGAALGVVAIVAGALVAPLLPGVDRPALLDWRRGGNGDGARLLTSPLVDIRSRLVDTSDTLLFTVDSSARSYWRLGGLDVFDGTQWGLKADTDQRADGALRSAPRRGSDEADQVVQTFVMDGLATKWLPAAYVAEEIRTNGAGDVRWDAETSTLVTNKATAAGSSYQVTSSVPRYSPEDLRSADPTVPRDLRFAVDLPDNFSETAGTIAQSVADQAGATTPYDQALALQQFFRETGGFTYSTDVQPGQDISAIDDFLDKRVGYCEQYAGTFAAMARSLGIPARVAVGYTWGEPDPVVPGRYQVLGRNAHAWPEVYLGEFGWVSFEPTPGRGNPESESYTGVNPSQVNPESTAATTPAPDQAAAEAAVAAAQAGLPPDEFAAAAAAANRLDGGDGWLRPVFTTVLLLVVAVGLYLLAVPGAIAFRRRRRRAGAAGSPSAEVGVAWAETTEALVVAGVTARPDETHAELARRAAEVLPAAGDPLQRLAGVADSAAYGPAPTAEDSATAGRAATEVHQAVDGSLSPVGRLRRLLDPRPLWRGRPRRHRTR